jgi:UDP-GlcNAc:undecaprenyl-phosphate GlcNAc-1-phosphate transferase
VVFISYLVQALLVLLAFFLRFQSAWLILFVYLLFSLVVLCFFHYAAKHGRQQQRLKVLVQSGKDWLQQVRERRQVQAGSFRFTTWIFYSLIFLSSLFSDQMDWITASLFVVVWCLLLLSWRFRPASLPRLIRMVFYLFIPFLVYGGNDNILLLLGPAGDLFLNVIFVLLLLTGMVVSFFSTRQQGFRSTPLDLLILLLVLVVPNLPGVSVYDQRLGLVALKCIIFYVSFEVVVAEKRGQLDGVLAVLALSIFVFALRSLCF